ncbi:TPA: hypothetical protein ACH3X3_006058 [Trebouxia sp. C0006]
MSCSSGHIARGKLVLQTGGRLVRLLRTCNLTRASGHRAFLSCAGQHVAHPSRSDPFSHGARILQDRRPNRWGCRLSTSCQVAASSPHAAVVETAEKKSSKQQNQLISLPTTDESPQLDRIRHSCSHVMAMAVQKLFPGAQVTIGPAIERGFYYDFDMPEPITEQDLKAVKKEMQRIIKADLPFTREEVSKEEAEERIKAIKEPYKLEILEGIVARHPNDPITIYHLGKQGGEGEHWWDLCAGPHVETTKDLNPAAMDLESLAGAYWRGDETKAQLQRIYGTAWESKEQLKAYQQLKVEAARRDHRKLGQELDLFSIESESAGGGLVFWHPNGAAIRNILENFWKEHHLKNGYQLLYTPHVAKAEMWKTSGHLDFYAENMFDRIKIEEELYQLRPMNCPFHIAVYKHKQYSYRDLPLRYAELGTVYRYERSGTMHGLFRVRGFTQDDGHIFCLPDQIATEIRGVLDMVEYVMGALGFSQLEINLSTKPAKAVGSDEIWERAEDALREALHTKGWDYKIDEGGGAFYGPKIDVKIQDVLGRKWQCSTIQLDFNLPERFQMAYTDDGNHKQQPIMIHRAIFGSIERFFGILIENCAGAFPLWLAPVQCRIMPVTDAVLDYAQDVVAQMREAGIRVQLDSGERIGKLIRNAEKAKTPVMCVVGEKEASNNQLSVRTYGEDGDRGVMAMAEVITRIQDASKTRMPF